MAHDVVIVGAGASGTFAARSLAASGADVCVIAAGPASCIMSRALAFVGEDGMPDSAAFERAWRDVLPVMWRGPDVFLGIDGVALEAARAGATSAGISRLPDGDIVACEVAGLPGPGAEVLGWRLERSAGRGIRAVRLGLQYAAADFLLGPVPWARRFDEEVRREELIAHLTRRLMDVGGEAFLLPPILGIETTDGIVEALETRMGATVLELHAGNGWPPGVRLAADLARALDAGGIEVVRDRVVEVEGRERRVRAVVTAGGERIQAGSFVLATGGIAGGGIRLDGTPRETVLGLPVHGADRTWTGGSARVDPALLFDAEPDGAHAAFAAGVRVDPDWRPLGIDGSAAWENVRACGAVVESRQHVGLDPGRSAWSGWQAAQRIEATLA